VPRREKFRVAANLKLRNVKGRKNFVNPVYGGLGKKGPHRKGGRRRLVWGDRGVPVRGKEWQCQLKTKKRPGPAYEKADTNECRGGGRRGKNKTKKKEVQEIGPK